VFTPYLNENPTTFPPSDLKEYINDGTYISYTVYDRNVVTIYTTVTLSVSLELNCYVANRLDNVVIGLTNDDPLTTSPTYTSSYTVCDQYGGSVAPGASATIVCSPVYQYFRFVIVQGSHSDSQAICLIEVSVNVRGK